jgi:two-component system, chemotaxis family, chemotaxis protein CheY
MFGLNTREVIRVILLCSLALNRTILLVDDDEDILDSLKIIFDSNGFVSTVAKNGKEAVEQYQNVKPDIVILDLMMPEYDGFYVLERIKNHNDKTRIFVVTGIISEESKRRLDDYNVVLLYKPIDTKSLIKKISELDNR